MSFTLYMPRDGLGLYHAILWATNPEARGSVNRRQMARRLRDELEGDDVETALGLRILLVETFPTIIRTRPLEDERVILIHHPTPLEYNLIGSPGPGSRQVLFQSTDPRFQELLGSLGITLATPSQST